MGIKFDTAEVPTSRAAGPSEYADTVKDLSADRSKAVTATVPAEEVDGLLRTLRHDAELLKVNATIRARRVPSKDGKHVAVTLWAVDKIKQNRQPAA